jgi:glutamyl-tRNA reductase
MKGAYQEALQFGAIGHVLRRVMPEVFRAAKAVRTDTRIGCSPLALSCVVFDLAARVFDDLPSTPLCLIGAGETIERHLAYAKERGYQEIYVLNRSLERGRALVARYGGEAKPLAALPEVLEKVDWVVSATATPLPLIGKGMMERVSLARGYRPMLCVDLAMPRDIEPEVSTINGVYLYNLHDLNQQIAKHRDHRAKEALEAEHMLVSFIDRCSEGLRLAARVDVIRQFRQQVEKERDVAIGKALLALAHGQVPSEVIEQSLYQLTQKLMHHPTKKLRRAAKDQDLDLLQLAAQLFTEDRV